MFSFFKHCFGMAKTSEDDDVSASAVATEIANIMNLYQLDSNERLTFFSPYGLYTAMEGFVRFIKNRDVYPEFNDLKNEFFAILKIPKHVFDMRCEITKNMEPRYMDQNKNFPTLTYVLLIDTKIPQNIFIDNTSTFLIRSPQSAKDATDCTDFVQEKICEKYKKLKNVQLQSSSKMDDDFDDMKAPLTINQKTIRAIICVTDIVVRDTWDRYEIPIMNVVLNKSIEAIFFGRYEYNFCKTENSLFVKLSNDRSVFDIYVKINLDDADPYFTFDQLVNFNAHQKLTKFHYIKVPTIEYNETHDLCKKIKKQIAKLSLNDEEKNQLNNFQCEQNVKFEMNRNGFKARAVTTCGEIKNACDNSTKWKSYTEYAHILVVNKKFGIVVCKKNTHEVLFCGVFGDNAKYLKDSENAKPEMTFEENVPKVYSREAILSFF